MANTYKFNLTAQQIEELLMKLYNGEGGVSVVTEVPTGAGVNDHLYVYYNELTGTSTLYYYFNDAWHQISGGGGGGEPEHYLVNATYINGVLTIIKNDGSPLVIPLPEAPLSITCSGSYSLRLDNDFIENEQGYSILIAGSESESLFNEIKIAISQEGKRYIVNNFFYNDDEISPQAYAIESGSNFLLEYYTCEGGKYLITTAGVDSQGRTLYMIYLEGFAI